MVHIVGTDFNDNNTENGIPILDFRFRPQINGTNGDDNIDAKAGDDIVSARGGRDVVFGGDGSDRISGGSGDDRLNGDGGLIPLSGNDTLLGESGNDRLNGQAGNDLIDGFGRNGSERDTLTGDLGNDNFVLGNSAGAYYLGSGYATITDFSFLSDDTITLFGEDEQYRFELGSRGGNYS